MNHNLQVTLATYLGHESTNYAMEFRSFEVQRLPSRNSNALLTYRGKNKKKINENPPNMLVQQKRMVSHSLIGTIMEFVKQALTKRHYFFGPNTQILLIFQTIVQTPLTLTLKRLKKKYPLFKPILLKVSITVAFCYLHPHHFLSTLK